MKPYAWEYFWEIWKNISANMIFVLLFLRCLSLKKSWTKRKLLIILLIVFPSTTLSCVCNFIHIDFIMTQMILFAFYFMSIHLFFQNKLSKKILVALLPSCISIMADKMTFFIGSFLLPSSLSAWIVQGNQRIYSTMMYLVMCILLSLLFLRLIQLDNYFTTPLSIATYKEKMNQTPLPQTGPSLKNVQSWKHDYKNHMITITRMAKEKQYSDLLKYLEEWQTSIPEYFSNISTGNTAIDAIVSSKLILARQEGIRFDHFIMLPSACPLSDLKLTTILGNLLDNSLEACKKIMEQEKEISPWIRLDIKTFRDMFQIQITNSSDGNYDRTPDNQLLTTKNETSSHGIGLQHVNDIVCSIHGILDIQPDQDQFKVTVLVPLSLSKGGLTNELCNCRR